MITHRLLISLTFVALAGCVDALKQHNEARRADARGQKIDAACAGKDIAGLDEAMRNESNSANWTRARDCLLRLKVEALEAADCPSFAAAFEDSVHMEGTIQVTKRNDRSSLARHLNDLPREQVDALHARVARKAIACGAGQVLFSQRRVPLGGPDGPEGWARVFASLEQPSLYTLLLSYLRHAVHDNLETKSIVTWLERTQSTAQCPELAAASEHAEGLRADLLFFFTRKHCKREAHAVASELLASRAPGLRARACLALRDLGDRSELPRMRLLAEHDTARQLETGYTGFWVIAFVSYPVREACQESINQLVLRQ